MQDLTKTTFLRWCGITLKYRPDNKNTNLFFSAIFVYPQ